MTEMQEDTTKELMGMKSETLDSLLCSSCPCPMNENPKECNKLMQFERTEDYFDTEEGEMKNMFYLRYICGCKLSEYQKNQEKK
ncbi:MAG: hypothetical protein NTV63_01510 [Candidatus Woesearchaeota archaeon]|nr:hypothetical protein [Candidatus Woesearchaeota archaeon]